MAASSEGYISGMFVTKPTVKSESKSPGRMQLATPKNRPAILCSSDLEKYAQTLNAYSTGTEYPVVLLPASSDMIDHLQTNKYGVVVVGAANPAINNNSLLKHISERQQLTEVIVISDRPDVSNAVKLMKAGAFDVLVPPIEPVRLAQSAEDAVTQFVEKKTRRRSEERNRALTSFEEIVGESPAMQLVRQTIGTIAPSDANVFVWGESGTGKELVAKALHSKSKRASKPFIAINCAALPKDILENELFGHEKGAFTGALSQKPGCFELADGGTLFLDEVGEMSSETQAKLLRAIEEQSF